MTFVLKSGTTGNTAEVDSDNKLQTRAVTVSASTFAAMNGDLYNVNSGVITLTSDSPSALLYMLNTNSETWVFSRVFYNAEVSTGGSGGWLAEVIANPTTGTLISAGTAITPYNLNFSNAKALTSTTLKGAEASTVTNGVTRVSTIVPASGTRVLLAFDSIVLEPGSSIAVRVTPPTGNTSMDIQVGFNLYRTN